VRVLMPVTQHERRAAQFSCLAVCSRDFPAELCDNTRQGRSAVLPPPSPPHPSAPSICALHEPAGESKLPAMQCTVRLQPGEQL